MKSLRKNNFYKTDREKRHKLTNIKNKKGGFIIGLVDIKRIIQKL